MAVDFLNGNTTRRYSVADSPDLTLPADDWSWLAVVRIYSVTDHSYIISINNPFSANSYNLVVISGGIQTFINSITSTLSLTVPLDTPMILRSSRVNGLLTTSMIKVGTHTLNKSATVSIAAEGAQNGSGLWLGSRANLDASRHIDGAMEHVIFVKGVAVTDGELLDMANGVPMDQLGFWNHRVFHAHLLESSAPQITDLVGSKILTQVGTGYGSNVQELGVKMHSGRTISRFLPAFIAAGGGISINGTIAALTFSGLTGQVDQGAGINATPASLILTGAAGQVDLGIGISGTPATLNISGLAGQVDLGTGINGIAASLSIIGLTGSVTLGSDILINGTPASLLMAGQTGQVDLGVSINGSIASIILTGLAGGVSIGSDILINGTPATINLSGLNATVTQETTINGTPATITLTGMVGAVSQDITINGTPASIALSPITGEVVHNTIISGTPATITLSGITGSITSGAVVTILAAQTIEMRLYNTSIDIGLYNSIIEIKS